MARPSSRVDGVRVSGPLAVFVDAYAAELAARGYRPLSVVGELRQARRLSAWLVVEEIAVGQLDRRRVEEFLACQRAGGRFRAQWSRPGLLVLLDVLRGLGVVGEEPVAQVSESELLLASFAGFCAASGVLPRARSRPMCGMHACSRTASETVAWLRSPPAM